VRTAAIAAAVTGATLVTAAWAQTPPGSYGYGPHMMGAWGWSGMFLGPLAMFLALAAAVAVVVLLVRGFGGPWHGPIAPPPRAPLDILKERFARGEIDKAEFEERRRVLGD
jgi:putative membrane protein